MKHIIILLVLMLFNQTSFSQKDWQLKETVGFGCFSGGSLSKPVIKFSNYLENKNYKKIVKHLNSKNTEEQFLSIYLSEKLEAENKIILTNNQKKIIIVLKESVELISVCSGCTYFSSVPLRSLFDSKENIILESAEYWYKHSNQKGSKGQMK